MRTALILAFILSIGRAAWAADEQPGAAEICGVYLLEDYGDITVHSLTEMHPYSRRQIHYSITNTEDPLVLGMVTGLCYCVHGPTASDPEFGGDADFLRLRVDAVTRGPFRGCPGRPQ
jgi:hypothetical protein